MKGNALGMYIIIIIINMCAARLEILTLAFRNKTHVVEAIFLLLYCIASRN